MIPNNQFWFNNKGNAYPPIETGYEYVASYVNLSPAFTERDGLAIIEVDGKLRMLGGWDPNQNPAWGPSDYTNQQWETVDGSTWTQIANAGWTPRHEFGCVDYNGKIWVLGGDGNVDVWTYDSINGWVQVTADWGPVVGARGAFVYCVHNNYIYIIGGSIFDCVRSNDGINWTKMSDLPNGLLPAYGNGSACSHRGYIYILGGGNGAQLKVYRSQTGATWEALPDLPTACNVTTYWSRVRSWADRLWYFEGTGGTGNQNGLWMSDDEGQTWKESYSFFMRARHAQGVNTFGNDLYMVAGNNAPDSNKISRVVYVPLSNKCVYSVRKAVSGYAGSCMRVRRSSDNAEQDIGFVGNDLDTASLATFVGANTGYVKTWYDQSGNGNDLTNATEATQPLIRAGGTTYTQNGKPAIYYDTTAKFLSLPSAINITSKYTISTVLNLDAGNKIIGRGDNNNANLIFNQAGSAVSHSNGQSPSFAVTASTYGFTTGTQRLLEVYRNRNTAWLYDNAVIKTGLAATNAAPYPGTNIYDTDNHFLRIGNDYGFGYAFTGYIQEWNLKTGVVESDSNVAIQADINGYFGIY